MATSADSRSFKSEIQRIMKLTERASTPEQFCAADGDINQCCGYLLAAVHTDSGSQLSLLDLQQTAMQLAQITATGLNLFSHAAQSQPGQQFKLQLVSLLVELSSALIICIANAHKRDPLSCDVGPSLAKQHGLMSPWASAANVVTAHLQQLQQQLRRPNPAGSSHIHEWLLLAGFLLQLWCGIQNASSEQEERFSTDRMPAIKAFEPAAQLAVTLCSWIEEFQVAGGGLGGESMPAVFDITINALSVFSDLLACPEAAQSCGAEELRFPVEALAGSIQQALLLNLACCIAHYRQLTGLSSSSSSHLVEVPQHHTAILQELGLAKLDAAQLGKGACRGKAGCDTAGSPLKAARAVSEHALMAVLNFLQLCDRVKKAGMRAAGASYVKTAAAAAAAGPSATASTAAADSSMFAVHPLRMQLLLLEALLVLQCHSSAQAMWIGLSVLMLVQRQVLDERFDDAIMEQYAQQVLMLLGPAVMALAGAQPAEVEGEAAAARNSLSSMQMYPSTDQVGHAVLTQTEPTPQQLLSAYARLLFATLMWLEERRAPSTNRLLPDISQQPFLSSRVLEAAMRTASGQPVWPGSASPCIPVTAHGMEMSWGADLISLAELGTGVAYYGSPSAPAAANSNRLAARLVSQLVSGLKLAEACSRSITQANMFWTVLHVVGSTVKAAVLTKQAPGQQMATVPWAVDGGPWVALVGRSFMALGKLLQLAPQWVSAPASAPPANSSEADRVATDLQGVTDAMAALVSAGLLLCVWSQTGLRAAAVSATGAGATCAGLNAAEAQKFLQQSKCLMELGKPALEWSAVHQAYTAAGSRPSAVLLGQLSDALTSFRDVCAAGELPAVLQSLGAACWDAFPIKHACNDPSCSNLDSLTEMGCASSRCGGCKVAHYCCKEHQVKHWKAHKAACKRLQQQRQQQQQGAA